MSSLPTGTVTFLFTDLEGSTRLLQRLGGRYETVLTELRRILFEEIAGGAGTVVETEGDGVFAVFPTARGAVAAICAAQARLAATRWGDGETLRVRAGLHTGEGRLVGSGYVGIDVHLAARIAAAGHGGQVLVSSSTKPLVEHHLPEGVALSDLGTHWLKDLEHPEQVFQLRIAGLPADFPPLRTPGIERSNLPPQVTSFLGRQAEVAEVRRLLSDSRLVTLTGPGGTGKTRLAIQAATEIVPDFGDGAYFVPLAPLRDPTLIAATAGRALGLPERTEEPPLETLKEHLATREILVVLDNFEQLQAGALLVSELLQAAPRLRVLVTSRATLRLSGEREYAVPPLQLPDPARQPVAEVAASDAVALFVNRAQAVARQFELTDDNVLAVADICVRLDGLPLAIELAAARAKVFNPSALLAQLSNSLSLLRGGPRDVPSRQQTLRDTIAWSYDLLSPDLQAVFRGLGVFVRGCTPEAAQAVVNSGQELSTDILDALITIADENLLRAEPVDDEGTRFRMLETIREFARAELEAAGELADASRRHLVYYLRLAEEAEPHFVAADQIDWLDRVERDHDNFGAALRWAIETGEAEAGMRMAAALWRFWLRRNRLREGRRLLEEVVMLPGGERYVEWRAKALTALGGLAYWQGDYEAAGAAYRETLDLYRGLGDERGIAAAQYNLGYIATIVGDLDDAWSLYSSARAIHAQLGDASSHAYDGLGMGLVAILRRDWGEAGEALEQGLAELRRLHDSWGVGNMTSVLARVRREAGDFDGARALLRESIGIFRTAGDRPLLSSSLGAAAAFLVATGRTEAGLRIGGGAEALEEEVGGRAPVALRPFEDPRRLAEAHLDAASIRRMWDEGRSLTLDELLRAAEREGFSSSPAEDR